MDLPRVDPGHIPLGARPRALPLVKADPDDLVGLTLVPMVRAARGAV